MSVWHPSRGEDVGETAAARAAAASRILERDLEATGEADWTLGRNQLERTLGLKHELSLDPMLRALLDLEHTGRLAIDPATARYRSPLPTDPLSAPLREVADAVLALGWPRPDGREYRTILETFVKLGGRYRHCDVYWAMHEQLKHRELESYARKLWRKRGEFDVARTIAADPSATVAEAAAAERKLESELVRAYLAQLGHRNYSTEAAVDPARALRADLLDRQAREVVEAKATDDGLVQALGQVARYRWLLNRNADRDQDTFPRVAVLLDRQPPEDDLRFVDSLDLGLDVVWRNLDGTFTRRRLS